MVASQNNFGNERNEKSLIINHGIVPKFFGSRDNFYHEKGASREHFFVFSWTSLFKCNYRDIQAIFFRKLLLALLIFGREKIKVEHWNKSDISKITPDVHQLNNFFLVWKYFLFYYYY